MLKKICSILVILIISINLSSFVLSDETPLDGMVGQVEDLSGKIEDTADKIQQFSKEDVKWESLGAAWQKILLKNPVVAYIDSILQKGNPIFLVLFARDYSISLTLIFIIILWFYFWIQFSKIFEMFSTFSSTTSLLISLTFVIIMAHSGLFNSISQLLFKFAFYRTGVWGWVWFGIVLFSVIFGSLFISKFFSSLKSAVLKRKAAAKATMSLDENLSIRNELKIYVDAFKDIFSAKKE